MEMRIILRDHNIYVILNKKYQIPLHLNYNNDFLIGISPSKHLLWYWPLDQQQERSSEI